MEHATLNDTLYFYFASNDTSGSGSDGATPVYDVRLAGAAASAIPVLSGSGTLLTHANYPAGCHEVAIAATSGNGFAAGNTYAVFCTLLVDSQNPTGFIGKFVLKPIIANVMQWNGTAVGTPDTAGFPKVTIKSGTGTGEVSLASGLVNITQAAADKVWGTAARTLTSFGTLVQDIWDKATSALTTVGSIGKLLVDNIDAAISGRAVAGDEMGLSNDAITAAKYDESTAFPVKSDDSGPTQIARVGADGDTLETLSDQIAAVQTDLDNPSQYKADVSALALEATVAGLNDLSATEVNDEVNDVISIDANVELASIPTTTGTLRQQVQYLFTYFRNKKTVTSTTETLMKEDASTPLGTATLSDDGTTFSKGEMN